MENDEAAPKSDGFWSYFGLGAAAKSQEQEQPAQEQNRHKANVRFSVAAPDDPPIVRRHSLKKGVTGLGFVELLETLMLSHEPSGNIDAGVASSEWSENSSLRSFGSYDSNSGEYLDYSNLLLSNAEVVAIEEIQERSEILHAALCEELRVDASERGNSIKMRLFQSDDNFEHEAEMALRDIQLLSEFLAEGGKSGSRRRIDSNKLLSLSIWNFDRVLNLNH